MTPPIPGQIYERDGLRREVVDVIDGDHEAWIVWRLHKRGLKTHSCDEVWNEWASKATLVEQTK